MASFSANISAFCKATRIKHDLVLRKLAFEGLRSVVMMTPVDTGRARGGWRVGINSVTPSAGQLDKGGSETINAGQVAMSRATFGDSIFITNNVKYIGKLERGSSRQAPKGMLGVTFYRLKSYVADLVRRVKSGSVRQ